MTETLHHRQVQARFSAAARTYSPIAHMQDRVATHVFDLLPDSFTPDRVLDAGCGPGRLLAMAHQRWPGATLTGIDSAAGMIAEGRRTLAGISVDFVQADLNTILPEPRFDLVLSSSALHWLNPFPAGLRNVASLVRPGGWFAMGLMLDGTLGELHAARRRAVPHKPPRGRLPTYDEFSSTLAGLAGMKVLHLERTSAQDTLPGGAEVLRAIHHMGVTGGDVSRSHAPLTRGEVQTLVETYNRMHATPHGVNLTFVIGFALLQATSSPLLHRKPSL